MNAIIYNNVWNTILNTLFLSFLVKPLWDLEKEASIFFQVVRRITFYELCILNTIYLHLPLYHQK